MSESIDPTPEPAPNNGGGETTETPARVKAPSQDELDALLPDRRLELLELERQRQDAEQDRQDQERQHRRQSTHQWINSGALIVGAVSLVFTLNTGQKQLSVGREQLRMGQEQLDIARESQITDRYAKAVEQLGSSQREVRTAAVYALERLMNHFSALGEHRINDSAQRDHRMIVEVLASYLRLHVQDQPPAGSHKTRLAVDVQAVFTVLGRRDRTSHEKGTFINLSSTNFHEKDLSATDLSTANLSHANLSGAFLRGANLSGANLSNAGLSGANLSNANLMDANLIRANVAGANLTGANLTNADLGGVVWSDETVWPDSVGGANGMRARSEPAGDKWPEGTLRIRE